MKKFKLEGKVGTMIEFRFRFTQKLEVVALLDQMALKGGI